MYLTNRMNEKPTFTNDLKKLWYWIWLYSLKIENSIINFCFEQYEAKVIEGDVNKSSLKYKLWLNIIERRNENIYGAIMRLEDKLSIF